MLVSWIEKHTGLAALLQVTSLEKPLHMSICYCTELVLRTIAMIFHHSDISIYECNVTQ